MPESDIAKATRAARAKTKAVKGGPAPLSAKERPPLKVVLRGHEIVLDAFDLTSAEKSEWRSYLDTLTRPDESDHFLTLSTVLIRRVDKTFTWEFASGSVKWREINDVISAGVPVEDDHPNG